ncbi:eCIS core domain-containing protein [Sorangium sp. So ce406]|uniref:eCIS core domain-containing protein n=1 Tax=Sorangium sp. So ce406 TaxID=3133311 RepID=UPI003F5C5418
MYERATRADPSRAPGTPSPTRSAQSPDVDPVASAESAGPVQAPAGLLVEDTTTPQAGQMGRSAFLQQLHEAVNQAAADVLGPLWALGGCPYIEAWFARHAGTDAARLEHLAQIYSGRSAPATAAEYIPPIVARLRSSIVRWSEGRSVQTDLGDAGMGGDAGAAVQMLSASSTVASSAPSPARVAVRLGSGVSLDSGTAARFGRALGASVDHVRLHADAHAAALANEMGAVAFTVGPHIGFSEGAFAPGTIRGDAILAHELAHVSQQRGARDAGRLEIAGAGEERSELERSADASAARTLQRLYGAPEAAAGREEASSTGLRLQRCKRREEPDRQVPPGGDPLPAPIDGSKELSRGRMTWHLTGHRMSSAAQQISFLPNATVGGRTVTFVQTVLQTRAGERTYAEDDAESRRFEAGSDRRRVDQFLADNELFYGARWDGTRWVAGENATDRDAGRRNAPSSAADPAYLYDEPMHNLRGDERQVFETVAIVPETREVLGALRWGTEYSSRPPYRRLLFGRTEDCQETASADFFAALDRFYEAKYEAILDGFAPGGADLTDAHRARLASTVSRLRASSDLVVEAGGYADLHEPDPAVVATRRAQSVKAYLVQQGIAEGRIQVVGYSSQWARVATTPGADAPANRRVQVWVHRQATR